MEMLIEVRKTTVAFGFRLLVGRNDALVKWPFEHECHIEFWDGFRKAWCEWGRPLDPCLLLKRAFSTHQVRFTRPEKRPKIPWFWKELREDQLVGFVHQDMCIWRLVIEHF